MNKIKPMTEEIRKKIDDLGGYQIDVGDAIDGFYKITVSTHVHFNTPTQPSAWSRFWMRVLLGWKFTKIKLIKYGELKDE